MTTKTEKHRARRTGTTWMAAIALSATLGAGGVATALAADGPLTGNEIPTLQRGDLLERSVEAHVSRERYENLYERAQDLEVAPERNLLKGSTRTPELQAGVATLTGEVAGEQARQTIKEKTRPEFGTPESVGVDQSTLDAIAACESGGSPTVVDASGTYHGKYQFDVGTWASVGGSGLPSAAPEAEQDYRAALLYSQAGSSPWPVCG